MVERLPVPLRREEPERNADGYGEERRCERELERRGEPLSDLGQHRLP